MEREQRPKKNQPVMIESRAFVFCPFFPGIRINMGGGIDPGKTHAKERRHGKERRERLSSSGRRWLKAAVCPLADTPRCAYEKYHYLRYHPELIPVLCNSKAIARLIGGPEPE